MSQYYYMCTQPSAQRSDVLSPTRVVANVPPTPISLAYEEKLGGSWISVMTIIITSISILLGGGSLTSYE